MGSGLGHTCKLCHVDVSSVAVLTWAVPGFAALQVSEGQEALQAAGSQSASMGEELAVTQATLAERQAVLDTAHAAVVEKDRRIATLQMDLRQQAAAVAMEEQQLRGAWRGGRVGDSAAAC